MKGKGEEEVKGQGRKGRDEGTKLRVKCKEEGEGHS